jgi:SHS2 domain-containing protein
MFKTMTISNNSIFAIIAGSEVNSFDNDVKAVTYYEANIKKYDDGLFEVIITLDI